MDGALPLVSDWTPSDPLTPRKRFEPKAFTAKSRASSAAVRARMVGRVPANPSTRKSVYSDPEGEFLAEVARWQSATGQRFPSATQLFALMLGLGYSRDGRVEAAVH